ncbi:hypothetical protein NA56DRAFT_659243 [Hyaloscypha hepaticicola]|uniref:Uncharacterized protein n=1 Tax=Hyaloscypha hepaticicola TaxID=2082293 RepID=A0A2J6Q4Q0_9HELO|nr:hypothetical protein NA56DRAFT_659243 [Hyaloscypha hepaticicola]
MPPRRGPDLKPELRARISELRSIQWSYKRIHVKYPEVSLSAIINACQREATRNDRSLTTPRTGAPRKLSLTDRGHVYDIISFRDPYIKNRDLLHEVDNKVKIRTMQKLCRELGRKKWL